MITTQDRKDVCTLAYSFIQMYGLTQSEAMKIAWRNIKLRKGMKDAIQHFYFQKMDGSVREAWGTLQDNVLPPTQGTERKKNNTVQVYYDTEKSEYRCFKKVNLLKIA